MLGYDKWAARTTTTAEQSRAEKETENNHAHHFL
jgi:hypothetical protein